MVPRNSCLYTKRDGLGRGYHLLVLSVGFGGADRGGGGDGASGGSCGRGGSDGGEAGRSNSRGGGRLCKS